MDCSHYYCGFEKPNKQRQIIDLVLMSIMFIMGFFIMVNGLIQVADLVKS